jgi:hypothetical protein
MNAAPAVPTSLVMPLSESVQKMWSELLGRPVAVKKTTPSVFSARTPGMVGTYVFDSGKLGALGVCDLALASHAGAALTLMPAAVALESIKAGRLTDTIVENVREVLNISATLFIHELMPHVRLKDIIPLPGKTPDDVTRVMARPAARMDLELTVGGYGAGKLAFLTA